MIRRVQFIRRTKEAASKIHVLAMPEGITQNMGIHGSRTGKTMTRIIYFDHMTTVPTPLPKL